MCRKVSFQGHNRMARVGFEPKPYQSQSRALNQRCKHTARELF